MAEGKGLPSDAQKRDGRHEACHEGAGNRQHPRPPVSHQELQTSLLLTSTQPANAKSHHIPLLLDQAGKNFFFDFLFFLDLTDL